MTDDGTIRPVHEDDWPAIKDIVEQIWDIGLSYWREQTYGYQIGGKPWQHHKTSEIYAELFAQPGNSYVTEVNGQVIGFCCLLMDPSTGIGEVGHNGVRPDCRGKGYGTRQLEFILDEMRRRGMKIAEVQTATNEKHAPARRMYERAGFQPIIGFQRYWMRLEE